MVEQVESQNPIGSSISDLFCDLSCPYYLMFADYTNSLISTTSIGSLTAAQYQHLLSFLNSDKVSDSVNFADNITHFLTPTSSFYYTLLLGTGATHHFYK